jgi:hypothetical protein
VNLVILLLNQNEIEISLKNSENKTAYEIAANSDIIKIF